ncbi:MAG: septation protein A [Casimicrobiaceae bacterium]
MQFLADYFPLVLFFLAYKWQGIYVATGVAMAASIAQIAWLHFSGRKIATVHWLSLGIIVIFGGATLILHDETFIKWKPTVLYALFGLTLMVGRLAFGRNLISSVMKGVELPASVWTSLTWSWIGFFAFMGVANWYVAFHYPTDTWVNFKVWGATGLFLLFAVAQGALLARYVEEPK